MGRIRKKSLLSWETDWPKAQARFWSKVNKTETCWLWTGTLQDKGYGQFSIRKKIHRAHRIMYRLTYGPIPEGYQVDHRCRVRHCVNPTHLRLATNRQNMQNLGLHPRNTSGVRGVTWVKATRKWKAQMSNGGKRIYVGSFDSIVDAEAAVTAKRLEMHTHLNEADTLVRHP